MPAALSDAPLAAISIIFLRLASVLLFFAFLAAVITLLLHFRPIESERSEALKLAGMLFGLCQGLLLSLIGCAALEALSYTLWLEFISQDLSVSYLHLITKAVIGFLAN